MKTIRVYGDANNWIDVEIEDDEFGKKYDLTEVKQGVAEGGQ